MRWQGAARIVLAIAGVGTAAVIGVYVSTRHRPPVSRPTVTTVADPATTLQTGQGTDLRYKGDTQGDNQTLAWKLDYQGTKDYPDGRIVRQGVHVTFNDGTEVWCDSAEIEGKSASGEAPSSLSLTGHVRLKGTDNALVQGDSATYADATQLVTFPGPVTFARGAMNGTGTDGTYRRDTGLFTIRTDPVVKTTPNDGGSPIEASAHGMVYTRDDKSMTFDGNARIGRQAETMTADHAVLHLSDDEQEFTLIELRGNSRVAQAPGKTSDLPDMQAEDIDLNFYPGGQALQHASLSQQASMVIRDANGTRSIAATTVLVSMAADGKTLTRLEGNDRVVVKTPPTATAAERTISAPSLVATGDDKSGLTAAIFTGGVSFLEHVPPLNGHPASTRTGTSQVLRMTLRGQLDAIDEARFETNVKFKDDDIAGDSDVGVYNVPKDTLDLMPMPSNAKRPPHVTDGSMTVDASDLVKIYLDTQNLDATGNVKTRSTNSDSGSAPKDTAIFNSTDPVYGTSDAFHYDDAAKVTEYRAAKGTSAWVRQKATNGTDGSVVGALDIVLHNDTQDLTATGDVHSTMYIIDDSDDTSDTSGSSAGASVTKAAPSSTTTPSASASGASKTAGASATGKASNGSGTAKTASAAPAAGGSGTAKTTSAAAASGEAAAPSRSSGASNMSSNASSASTSGKPSSAAKPSSTSGSGSDTASSDTEPKAPTRYDATADSLVYTDATRTATYVGTPALLKSADGLQNGKTIALVLKPDSRALDQLIATDEVYFKMTENNREGRGDRLLYETDENRYTLTGGSPQLTLKSRNDDGTCSLSKGSKVVFWRDTRAAEWPEAPGGFATNSTKISCADPLPK